MEVEAKYRVALSDFAKITQLEQLGGYHLRPEPQLEQQQNDYFDTADRRLAQARYGLRLRQIAERHLVTLKGPADVQEGLYRRAEYEFPHDNPDPHSWPSGPARELALALIGQAELIHTIRIATKRRVIFAEAHGKTVAELCLDHSTIYAGEHTQEFSELEIELLPGGAIADLKALAEALREQIDLTPEPKSKLQRGLALLQ